MLKRKELEKEQFSIRNNKIPRWLWQFFFIVYNSIDILLKYTKFYKKWKQNALNIKITQHELFFENLPISFDGYTIMHLSDLHIDKLHEVETAIINSVKNISCDICVITGDYREGIFSNDNGLYTSLGNIFKNINSNDGILATMGNHDTHEMIKPLENAGLQMLLNETLDIVKGNEKISFTGVDDPHFYYSQDIENAIKSSTNPFKILLVHTSEVYKIAYKYNYQLYLCGHTHGGQICKANGNAIITNVRSGKKYNKGLWKYKDMHGYTLRGTGVCAISVRINSFSEIALITLRRKN